MTDTHQTETAPAPAAEPKKRKVSERIVLDAEGNPQDEWTGAQGFTYRSLEEDFALTVMFGDLPADIVSGLTAFGALTLAGNVTNAVRNNDKAAPDASEKEALLAWLENLKAGNWTKPSGEIEAGIGTLAEAYVRVLADAGETVELSETVEKLKAASKETKKALRADPQVKAKFTAILAERAAARAAEAKGGLAIRL